MRCLRSPDDVRHRAPGFGVRCASSSSSSSLLCWSGCRLAWLRGKTGRRPGRQTGTRERRRRRGEAGVACPGIFPTGKAGTDDAMGREKKKIRGAGRSLEPFYPATPRPTRCTYPAYVAHLPRAWHSAAVLCLQRVAPRFQLFAGVDAAVLLRFCAEIRWSALSPVSDHLLAARTNGAQSVVVNGWQLLCCQTSSSLAHAVQTGSSVWSRLPLLASSPRPAMLRTSRILRRIRRGQRTNCLPRFSTGDGTLGTSSQLDKSATGLAHVRLVTSHSLHFAAFSSPSSALLHCEGTGDNKQAK